MRVWLDPDGLSAQSLGWVATLLTVCLFTSPVTTMRDVASRSGTAGYSDTPYLVSLLNCLLWLSYLALTPGRLTPVLCNIFGAVVQSVYLAVFLWYHSKDARRRLIGKLLALLLAFGSAICAAVIVGRGEQHRAELLLGYAAAGLNVLMYASPLEVMRSVVREKSVEFMPFGLSLMTLLASIFWSLYAFGVGDLFISLPNWGGVFLGVAQVLLYVLVARAQRLSAGSLLASDSPEGQAREAAVTSAPM